MEWEAKSRERDRTPPLTSRLSPSHFAPWAGLRPMRRYGRREGGGEETRSETKSEGNDVSVTGLFHLRSLVIHLGFSVPSVHSSFTPEETRRGYEGDEEVRRDKARIDRGCG